MRCSNPPANVLDDLAYASLTDVEELVLSVLLERSKETESTRTTRQLVQSLRARRAA